jgi:hypothetical protein
VVKDRPQMRATPPARFDWSGLVPPGKSGPGGPVKGWAKWLETAGNRFVLSLTVTFVTASINVWIQVYQYF